MKKLRIYIVSLLALVSVQSAMACSIAETEPWRTILYRLSPKWFETDSYQWSLFSYYGFNNRQYMLQRFDYREENIALWQQQTSADIPAKDIEQTVYRHTLADLEKHLSKGKPCNKFEKWIKKNGRQDITELLLTAKATEENRAEMTDPWYYGYDEDECHVALRQALQKVAGKDGPLFNRWVLQAVRMMTALGQDDECLAYWEQVRDRMTDDVVRNIAELKVASSLFKKGRKSEAAAIYARYGDIASLELCQPVPMSSEDVEKVDEMVTVYEACPDSPYFDEEIQQLLIHFDNHLLRDVKNEDEAWFYHSAQSYDRELSKARKFMDLCQRVLREKKVKNLAMWYFAAAAMSDAMDQPREALQYIRQGLPLCDDAFLQESFRILRVYDRARLAAFNDDYERQLLVELRWLDWKLVSHLGQEDIESLRDINYKWSANTYFYNDAMRRLVFDELVPKALKAGRFQRALQLANYADNRLCQKVKAKKTEDWGKGQTFNNHDYSNHLFALMDTLPAREVDVYYRQLYSQNVDSLSRFLNLRSYRDRNYWRDIVGTFYIRDMQFGKAVALLRQNPKDFQGHLNVAPYLNRDPFDFKTWNNGHLKDTVDYKLQFAREMYRLEQLMQSSADANERGEAMIRYAIGLKNSENRCWPLTRYSDSVANEWYFDGEDFVRTPPSKLQLTSELFIEKGLATIEDVERRARQLHLLSRNREVMDYYGDTETARQLRAHCDIWRDYQIASR